MIQLSFDLKFGGNMEPIAAGPVNSLYDQMQRMAINDADIVDINQCTGVNLPNKTFNVIFRTVPPSDYIA